MDKNQAAIDSNHRKIKKFNTAKNGVLELVL